ncbi:hypothetical protein GALMADRAFT_255843 [Galerina marginata CBS 339.88]|uniref:Uncharacterized protein n=1 Tax=Galerina marginata (strain CBS 339.88) TaxID=685588 RepID=A0A067SI18_GALM3|nr:hypothetical protein GALMADRAFT_255843 [Galerina marginata CBS 339.88]
MSLWTRLSSARGVAGVTQAVETVPICQANARACFVFEAGQNTAPLCIPLLFVLISIEGRSQHNYVVDSTITRHSLCRHWLRLVGLAPLDVEL